MPFIIEYDATAEILAIDGRVTLAEVGDFKLALDTVLLEAKGGPNNWHTLFLEQIVAGNKIAAIKLWITIAHVGLYEAKVYVEAIMNHTQTPPMGTEYPNILPDDLDYHRRFIDRSQSSYPVPRSQRLSPRDIEMGVKSTVGPADR